MRRSHLDLCCLQKPIIIACGSERVKELAVELGPVFAHLFQQSLDKGEIPKE